MMKSTLNFMARGMIFPTILTLLFGDEMRDGSGHILCCLNFLNWVHFH
jgi:hypothetical protein